MLGRWTWVALALVAQAGMVGAAVQAPPTSGGAEIVAPPCGARGTTCGGPGVVLPGAELALGALTFNSPYLFGSQALHDAVTCRSCHGDCGLSGPALRLTFDAPVPRLHGRRWRGPESRRGDDPNLEAFARRAIVEEFDGPEPPADIVAALAAYVRQLPEAGAPGALRLSALDVVVVGLSLADDALARGDRGRIDFILETARFLVGEAAMDARRDPGEPDAALIAINVELKTIGTLASAGRSDECRRAVQDLTARLKQLSPGLRPLGACASSR